MDVRRRAAAAALLLMLILRRKRTFKEVKNIKKKGRKVWVKKIFLKRKQQGAYCNLLKEMRISDRENYFR